MYLCLLRVYLRPGEDASDSSAGSAAAPPSAPDASSNGGTGGGSGGGGRGSPIGGLDDAVSLLERHFSRVDPVKAMALLPPDVPVKKLLSFLGSAVRHAEARRRNNQARSRIC